MPDRYVVIPYGRGHAVFDRTNKRVVQPAPVSVRDAEQRADRLNTRERAAT